MEAMFLLIAISVLFVVAIGVAFWWAIFAGQFDSSDTAGRSILHDSEADPGPNLNAELNEEQVDSASDAQNGAAQKNTLSVNPDEATQAKTPR